MIYVSSSVDDVCFVVGFWGCFLVVVGLLLFFVGFFVFVVVFNRILWKYVFCIYLFIYLFMPFYDVVSCV